MSKQALPLQPSPSILPLAKLQLHSPFLALSLSYTGWHRNNIAYANNSTEYILCFILAVSSFHPILATASKYSLLLHLQYAPSSESIAIADQQ